MDFNKSNNLKTNDKEHLWCLHEACTISEREFMNKKQLQNHYYMYLEIHTRLYSQNSCLG